LQRRTHHRFGRRGRLRAVAALALVAAAALAFAGCAGKVKQQKLAADFDPLATTEQRYAVAGFVAAPAADLDDRRLAGDHLAQSDAWGALLHGALLGGPHPVVTWAWPAVRDNVPPDDVVAVQAAYAAGDPVGGDLLRALADDLPEIAYAVLARLDENTIETSDYDQPGLMREEAREDRGVELMPSSLQRTAKIRRTVTVTLTVFDLAGSRAVWRGTVSRDRTELLSPKSIEEKQDLVVKPAAGEDELPELEMRGASLDPPALEALLADACGALVANLFAPSE
jgi:hypothetical protein